MRASSLTSTTLLAILAFVAFAGCSEEPGPTVIAPTAGDVLATIPTEEGTREYWVHVPPGLDGTTPVPLVVAIHGAGGTPEGLKQAVGFDAEADRRGFVVVYPRGLERTWRVVGSQKDVDFLSGMVEQIAAGLAIDRSRVFAVGISQGALMSHRLGCTEPAFKAIGSIAASVSKFFENCTHPDPGPALFILGTEDPIYPFDEPSGSALGHWGGVGGAEFWARRIGCTAEPTMEALPDVADDGMMTTLWIYGGCPRGEVRLYGVNGGGHTWPGVGSGNTPLGPVTLDFNATQTVLDFFFSI